MIKVDGLEFIPGYFPDNTLLLKADYRKSTEETELSWYFENNEELVSLIFLVQHLKAKGRNNINLFMPYIPNSRQDRVKTNADVFTLKYFANVINWLGFKKVTVLDPHSYVSEALFEHLEVIYPDKLVTEIAAGIPDVLFFYPDEGAAKRYSSKFEYPFAFGIKNRDWQTGQIRALDIFGESRLIENKDIIIVDDICSKGGTFYHSAKALKARGAGNIYLFITHCENTILEGDLLKSGLIRRVYTTNSIFTRSHPDIEVINIRESGA